MRRRILEIIWDEDVIQKPVAQAPGGPPGGGAS